MTVRVVVDVDLSGLSDVPERCDAAQRLLASAVADDSNDFIPVESGSLHDAVQVGDDSVVWAQPYATYAYRQAPRPGPNKYGTDPHSRWFEAAKRTKLKRWKQVVADALKRRL